ncbi:hypothetical protein A2U01_0115673, partial [Trifolium medium]|nr:hypothetical protein [Trifolium medium]
VPCAVRRLG